MLAAGGTVSLTPASAQSRDVEPRMAVRVGAATTDNLGRRASTAATGRETFTTTGIDIGFLRETTRARVYADGALDYYAYNSDEFSNETAGSIDTGVAFHIAPDTFSWDFTERIDHARLDPFAPGGPGNSERINSFSTGPRVTVPLGDNATFGLVAQYNDRQYRDSEDLDGPTRAVGVELGRDFGEGQRLSLQVTGQDIRFDDPTSLPYEIQEAFVTYQRRTASDGIFEIAAGSSRLRRESGSQSEPYVQLEWSAALTSRSVISFEGGKRFESPADFFDAGTLVGYASGGVDDTLLTPDPRMTTDARLSYTLTRPRAIFTARRERFRETYEESSLASERDVSQTSVGMDYRFTPQLVARIQLVASDEVFEPDGEADEERIGASLQRRLGRSWQGSLGFEYNARDTNAGESFSERRYILSLLWSPVSVR
jgi:hypothetical protein